MVGFKPHNGKQTEFLKATADWVFYGGARGGGKSLMLSWKAALTPRSLSYWHGRREILKHQYNTLKKAKKNVEIKIEKISIDYPDYIAILIRRTYPQLERNLKPECNKLYKLYGARWQERNKCYLFPSGAKVYLVHCQDRRALDNYIGGNYTFIGIDEANQFPEEWIDELSTSCRTSNPALKPQICLTSNPGNIGHVWLKRRFVDRCDPINDGDPIYSEVFDVSYQPKKTAPIFYDEENIGFQFIPATVFDNPSITENDPGYVKKLKQLNPILRAMWLEGRWDVFAGTFFDNWSIMHNIIPKENFSFGKHFKKDTHALYRFYDYGTKNPFVCIFGAQDRDGNLIIFDEIKETGLSASKQAQLVNKYTYAKYKLLPKDFDDEIADPAYWAKISEKEGALYSPSMFYGDDGIYLSKGINDRKVGAKMVYEALELPDDGVPRLRFTENCLYSIETIPNLPAAENDPEDIDTKAEDHAYDAIRYGVTRVLSSVSDKVPKKRGWRKQMEEKGAHSHKNWKIM
tara:strand:+ start:197 stop:1747 length:1551 start_codon:yes stop_codon:yes gene_type:complete